MASTQLYKCKCGQTYYVYVPKKLMLKEAGFGPEVIKVAEGLDEKERRAGEIEIAEKFAEHIGAKFIDARVKKVIQCKCGKVFDILAFIYEKK